MRSLEDKFLLVLIVAASLAMAWILLPFYGAILWGVVAAIMFAPLYRLLARALGQRRSLAALCTVAIIVMIVILPLTLMAGSLAQEASGVYGRVQSGELDIVRSCNACWMRCPPPVMNLLNRFGLGSLAGMQEKLSAGLLKGSQVLAAQALDHRSEHLRLLRQPVRHAVPAVLPAA